jgi:TolA-binding protein
MQPDAPIGYLLKFWPWIDANKKGILGGTGIVIFVVFLVSFYLWQKEQKEMTAGTALTKAALSASTRSSLANVYLKINADYPGTKAGTRALLQAATVLFVENKFNEAQGQFQRFLDSYPDNSFAAQAALGVAACLDAQGKTDAAMKAYNNVINQFSDENAFAEAKFSVARINDSQGKLADAQKAYEDVARVCPYTSLGEEAAVRAVELKLKLPPAPVPSTPATPRSFPLFNTNPPAASSSPH